MLGDCTVSCSGEAVFACNTAGNHYGGALVVHDSSQVFWSGKTQFYDNWAGDFGGAIAVHHSNVFSSGNTSYDRNSALFGARGILVLDNCTISWSGETTFAFNTCKNYSGGVLVVHDSSQAFWSGKTQFSENWAGVGGGAMVVYNHSCVFGSGDTTFARNDALDNAGGILVRSVIAPYRGAGKRLLLLIQLKTMVEARSLYTTALKPFGERKHDSMITGPACMGVPWLFTSTPTFSVAGIRHMTEMVQLILQGPF